MKSKIAIIVSCLTLLCSSVSGQIKKEYYANGNLKFEGQYVYVWKQDDLEEYDLPEEGDYRNAGNMKNEDFQKLSMLKNLAASKVFEGFCTFYYYNGAKHFEGTYSYGTKNGKFTYWNSNSEKAAELYFKNGMADGKWQYWENGKLKQEFNYKAFGQDSIAKYSIYGMTLYDAVQYSNGYKSLLRNRKAFEDAKAIDFAYQQRVYTFDTFIKSNLYWPAILDGRFIVNKEGKPYLEFHYEMNVPTGTWRIYENNTLAFECTFSNGKATNAKEYIHPEWNDKAAKYNDILRQDSIKKASYRQGNSMLSDSPNAVDPGPIVGTDDPGYSSRSGGPIESSKIFTSVEQPADFPGGQTGLLKYFAANMKYPPDALKNNIQGKVTVQFVILPTGKIDTTTIEIKRSTGYGMTEEAIRLVKAMPDWKPARQNGTNVAVYYTLPIKFSLNK